MSNLLFPVRVESAPPGCECATEIAEVYEVWVTHDPEPEESIEMTYEQSVIDLADELARQFDGLSISDALARANEIMQSSIEVEAYLEVMEDDQ